jgi:nucleoside-diphosphate-sugar epimerase
VISFVTGATGFLGRRLVSELLSRGDEVRCLVRPSADTDSLRVLAESSPGRGRLRLVRGTLAQVDQLAEQVQGCQVIYHVAAALKGATAVLFLNNVVATEAMVALAARWGVGRFVLVSSLAVYGTASLCPREVLDERCPLDPAAHARDPYTYSKVAQELAAREEAQKLGLPLVVVRPGVIYGPGRECLSARVGLQFGRFLVRMGGRQWLPYTHVENCARAVALAGVAPGVEGEAFNVVDDAPPTADQLVRRYRRSVGGIRTLRIPHAAIQPLSRLCEWYHRRSNGQLPAVLTPYKSAAMWKVLRYGNEKAKRKLGWEPRIGFDAGLDQTLSSLRESRQAGERRSTRV